MGPAVLTENKYAGVTADGVRVSSSFPRTIRSPELHKEETLRKVIMGKEQQGAGMEGTSGGSKHLESRRAPVGSTPFQKEVGKKSKLKRPCLASPLALKVHSGSSAFKPTGWLFWPLS